jgi:hypothetical protein
MFQFTSNDTITVEVVKTDDTLPAKINIEIIPVKRYQVEQSYAFSLNWEDYANPTEAINCGDTFYELVYNKVYTVSQFIDRYATKKFIRNTVGIKNIQDDSCEGNYNKFPTNDAYYRTDFFFVFIKSSTPGKLGFDELEKLVDGPKSIGSKLSLISSKPSNFGPSWIVSIMFI